MPKILFATDTPGHTAGYYVVSRGLSAAGFEVIVAGPQLPAAAATAALEEGADILAYRIMDRDPIEVVKEAIAGFRAQESSPLPIIVGGIITRREADQLTELGVAGVFRPGARLSDISACAYQSLEQADARPG